MEDGDRAVGTGDIVERVGADRRRCVASKTLQARARALRALIAKRRARLS